MVQRGRQRYNPPPSHQAEGGLKSHDPAEARGNADGAAGVRAKGCGAHPRRGRRAGAATGAAGDPLQVPRVAGGTVVGVLVCDAVGELVHVQLADEHRSRRLQPADDRRVLRGHAARQHLAAGGGPDTLGVKEVLQTQGNAVERTEIAVGHDRGLGIPGLAQRLVGGHGDVGVHARVQRIDPRQDRLGQLHRREAAVRDHRGCLGDAQVAEVLVRHLVPRPAGPGALGSLL